MNCLAADPLALTGAAFTLADAYVELVTGTICCNGLDHVIVIDQSDYVTT